MKTRSKALYAYLFDAGVLNGTPEEIDCAKRAYRRTYKRAWKQERKSTKEIRIGFALQQFEAIRRTARLHGLPHTTYARNAVLAATGIKQYAIGREELQQVLQLVGMAINALQKGSQSSHSSFELLEQAEIILLKKIRP